VTGVNTRRIAILISGRGNNMQAIIEACRAGHLDGEVSLVVSNNPRAEGLARAAEAGITTAIIDHRKFPGREAFDQALVQCLGNQPADLIILAGFMRILGAVFIDAFRGRLLNIHPSLLPKYPGLNTHQRALDAGDREAGATVHFVTAELDGGPPVLQSRLHIEPGDTADSLAQRILVQELEIYPIAASWFLQGRLKLTDRGATLDDTLIPPTGIPYVPAA
jgi:phosphoribosylglycinamide formyltransferase-1